MSKIQKQKHIDLIQGNLSIPKEKEFIVRIDDAPGGHLYVVSDSKGEKFLASMPGSLRGLYVKPGNFGLVKRMDEGTKVKGEFTKIVTQEHIEFYQSQNVWPQEFNTALRNRRPVNNPNDQDDELFVNTNRYNQNSNTDSSSDSNSDSD